MPSNVSNLVLFGAGASSGSDTHGTPPLGSALFDELATCERETWGQIEPAEADVFRDDFEKGMMEYAELHSTDGMVDTLQCAMANFFFGFEPRTSSLYVKFARWMRRTRWNGAVASLNYERLLQLSLCQVELKYFVGRPATDSIELCLPHGCCNLFINLQGKGPLVLGSMNLKVDSQSPPKQIDNPAEFHKRIKGDKFPPVMCNIQPDKWLRSGESFIEKQRQRFADMVNSASIVAIIGVKVRPDDTHIWCPLSEANGKIIYCTGPKSGEEFRKWAHDTGRKGDEDLSAYWDEGFDTVCSAVGIMPIA